MNISAKRLIAKKRNQAVYDLVFDLQGCAIMKSFIAVSLWFLLLILCWPVALLMLFLFPLIWLILLPFRIVGFTLDVVLKLIGNIFLFPFRRY